MEPISSGFRPASFNAVTQKAQNSFAPTFGCGSADTFSRSAENPRFGHGNPGKHPDKLKEAYRREYRRNRDKLPGVSIEQFVANKMAAKLEGKKGNTLRK